jgi:hypothetical protein
LKERFYLNFLFGVMESFCFVPEVSFQSCPLCDQLTGQFCAEGEITWFCDVTKPGKCFNFLLWGKIRHWESIHTELLVHPMLAMIR